MWLMLGGTLPSCNVCQVLCGAVERLVPLWPCAAQANKLSQCDIERHLHDLPETEVKQT